MRTNEIDKGTFLCVSRSVQVVFPLPSLDFLLQNSQNTANYAGFVHLRTTRRETYFLTFFLNLQ